MKIKKKKVVTQKTLDVKHKDHKNFYIIILILLLANLLIFFTAFPALDDIAAVDQRHDAASRATFVKLTVIVITDVFLFVTLSMVLTRRSKDHKKR